MSERILTALRDGPLRGSEIARLLGIPERQARQQLRRLAERGDITRTAAKPGKAGLWVLHTTSREMVWLHQQRKTQVGRFLSSRSGENMEVSR